MDAETVAIYENIFRVTESSRLYSATTLAFAEINGQVVGAMNGASGLVTKRLRCEIPEARYFSINSTLDDVVSLEPNGQIQRFPNRHAEMNIVMYALSAHLAAGGSVGNFVLDHYLTALNTTKVICPECQLAVALLSNSGGALISSICDHLWNAQDGTRSIVLRTPSDHMRSPNWAPPWRTYYSDIPGSDLFRPAHQQLDPGDGPFFITSDGSGVSVWKGDGPPARIRRPSWVI